MNSGNLTNNLQFAAKWAFLGIALGLLAFIYNYTMVPISLPGYEIIAAPAMYAMSFFSEETPFWPKMAIFMTGQYLGYLLIILLLRFLLSTRVKVTH